jgi:hypothetical protein
MTMRTTSVIFLLVESDERLLSAQKTFESKFRRVRRSRGFATLDLVENRDRSVAVALLRGQFEVLSCPADALA